MNNNLTKASPIKQDGHFAGICATIFILFFLTRPCPFPSGTYWDLLYARDFEVEFGLTLIPETLSFIIEQSFGSLTTLKTVYHLVFFLLCGILTISVFKAREIFPGLVVLAIFAFGMQPLLSLRWSIQLVLLAGIVLGFDGNWFRNSYGVALIPIMAAVSALGLPVWLFLIYVVCQVLLGKEFYSSLLLCSLIGILVFPEGAVYSIVGPTPPSIRFPDPEDVLLMNLLSGIFLLTSLLSLSRLTDREIPNLVFFALTGFLALTNHHFSPIFILIGTLLTLKALSTIRLFPLLSKIISLLLLTIFLNFFFFLNPVGFKINPQIRGELGPALSPLITGEVKRGRLPAWNIGELVWKGLLSLDQGDLENLRGNSSVQIFSFDNVYKILASGSNQGSNEEKIEGKGSGIKNSGEGGRNEAGYWAPNAGN
ncbi:hypothetical protein HYY75_05105 [bacterium]|nr:hypothetical protein [bacterium]